MCMNVNLDLSHIVRIDSNTFEYVYDSCQDMIEHILDQNNRRNRRDRELEQLDY